MNSDRIDLTPPGLGQIPSLTIPSIVSGAIQLIVAVAFVIFFIVLVVGGIQWITSGGDKAHTEAARGRITAALVGLVIVVSAWAIAQLISQFFGVNILTPVIPKAY